MHVAFSVNIVQCITCSWHQKNETTNSTVHEFRNLKCYKMSFKAFRMKTSKAQNVFFVINKKKYIINKKGLFKRLWPLCTNLNSWIGEFVVSFFDVTNRSVAWHWVLEPSVYVLKIYRSVSSFLKLGGQVLMRHPAHPPVTTLL